MEVWQIELLKIGGAALIAFFGGLVWSGDRGLFLGWFSPTQAGAAGAAGALLIGLLRRQLNWQGFLFAVKDALRITCMVTVIVTGAMFFGHFIKSRHFCPVLQGIEVKSNSQKNRLVLK